MKIIFKVGYMKKIVSLWKELGRTIYTGRRLTLNLTALTLVSLVCVMLGVILIFIDIITKR